MTIPFFELLLLGLGLWMLMRLFGGKERNLSGLEWERFLGELRSSYRSNPWIWRVWLLVIFLFVFGISFHGILLFVILIVVPLYLILQTRQKSSPIHFEASPPQPPSRTKEMVPALTDDSDLKESSSAIGPILGFIAILILLPMAGMLFSHSQSMKSVKVNPLLRTPKPVESSPPPPIPINRVLPEAKVSQFEFESGAGSETPKKTFESLSSTRPEEFESVAEQPSSDHLVLQPTEALELPVGPDRKVTLVSDLHADGSKANEELLNRAAELLVLAVNESQDLQIENWLPSRDWLSQKARLPDIEAEETHVDSEVGPLRLRRYRLDLEISSDLLGQVSEHFHEERSKDRTLRLATSYAGTVLILGGLAIFLRLRTGRKPS